MPQIPAAISRATGRSIPYVQIPIETLRQHNADAALVYDFVNEGSLQVDISALRKLHPGLMDFGTWLRNLQVVQPGVFSSEMPTHPRLDLKQAASLFSKFL
ncbi:MAG: hypothetical protein JO202_05765 [Ktedonobacteraceae bacterium]|nr:hypothetical protein [Ktedonobacteraceae bacterium]